VDLLQTAMLQGIDFAYVHADIALDSLRSYPPFVEFIRPKG
jgi:hypothetical protein